MEIAPRCCAAIAAAVALSAGTACGARTGLYDAYVVVEGGTGAPDTGLDGGGDDAAGTGGLCSLAGPVASCDAGPGGGPVQRCVAPYSVCAQMSSPGWGCCTPDLMSCAWAQFLPDASCM